MLRQPSAGIGEQAGRHAIGIKLNRYNLTVHPPIEKRWRKIGELSPRLNVTFWNRSDYIYLSGLDWNCSGHDDRDS